MRKFERQILFGTLIVVLLLIGNAYASTEWPSKTIRLTICYGAGGTTDLSARMIASIIEKDLGQKVICENRPGGAGVVAASLAAKTRPDGYNLFTLPSTPAVIAPHRQNLPYDPMKDFSFICQYATWHFGLVVPASSPFKTLQDLIKYAKENPGKVSYGLSGSGNTQHLVMERIRMKENIDWRAIPFKSGPEAISSCLGGHVTASAGVTEWVPQVKSGEMRLLVIFDEERMKEFPAVPTLKELGYGFSASAFLGIAGPAGIPQDITAKIEKAIEKATQQPEFIKLMDRMLFKIQFVGSQGFKDYAKASYAVQGEIIKAAGLARKK